MAKLKQLVSTAIKTEHGIYIHIPFCRRRCHYCDFAIIPIGDRKSTQSSRSKEYSSLLDREIDLYVNNVKRNDIETIDTVYFGGGTPSLLSDESIEKIIGKLRSSFIFKKDIEITLEMDPGTFDRERIDRLNSLGINRISMGVQSFNDDILRKCGRAHSSMDAYKAIESVHASSIQNFNIDLISSLPYLTLDLWQETLLEALRAQSTHISVYDLQIEDKTAFGRWYSPGVFPLPSEGVSSDMYSMAVSTLTGTSPSSLNYETSEYDEKKASFEHYEISNYAKPGYRSRHNQRYWDCKPTIAFGMAAASYLHGNRYTRPNTFSSYEQWLNESEKNGEHFVSLVLGSSLEKRQQQPDQQVDDILEYIMLRLRTSDGLNIPEFQRRYGIKQFERVRRALQPFKEQKLVISSKMRSKEAHDVETIRLVDPAGFLLSNDIISSVFAAVDAN